MRGFQVLNSPPRRKQWLVEMLPILFCLAKRWVGGKLESRELPKPQQITLLSQGNINSAALAAISDPKVTKTLSAADLDPKPLRRRRMTQSSSVKAALSRSGAAN